MPYLITSDQAKIAYDDRGSGRPLLLVHGWATHAGFFRPQVDGLAGSFRVVGVDLRGHGRSTGAGDDLSIDILARDITELAARLDLNDLLVVGWSMGAMVLWRALLNGLAPRVAGMISIDMAPRVINGEDWHLGLRGSSAAKSARQNPASMVANWATVGPRVAGRIFAEGREAEQAALRRWAEAEVAASDPVAMARLWASLTAQDFRQLLPGLTLPVLVAHGKLSRLYPEGTAPALASLLPHALTVGFERSGHAPHLEEPDLFNSTLTRFAATLPPPGGADATGAGRAEPAGA